MRNEYDFGKALKYIAFDLETRTGQYNLGRQFTETLDRASEVGAVWFMEHMDTVHFRTRRRMYEHPARDLFLETDGLMRLKKHIRQLAREHYIETIVQLLTVGADEREPEEVGISIAYNILCKTK